MRKKLITTILAVLILVGLLPLSAMAATDTCILAQPQNYVYNEGAVAIYYVTVAGENLKCTWYLDFDGQTYDLSAPNMSDPWLSYVVGDCGSAEEKDNLGFTPSHTTFSYHFNGCEAGLDGAYIYAEIYDGWDSVESSKARIQLSEGAKSPPQVFVPAQMEACKGDKVELTCSAVSVYGGALSYTWYETPDGDLTKIRAIDRGAETDATLVCDTDSCGTRYYVCAVDEKDGGVTYSSVIPVTVTEEKTVDPPAEVKTQVVFTNGSTFEVGGTAAVDFLKTSQNVMNDPNIMADMYNAALEQDMDVTWICSDGAGKKGKSVAWTAEDAGKEYVCRVSFYADDELTEFIDYVDSEPFVISVGSGSATPKIPNITTDSLQDGRVGKEYYKKLECTDPDVRWELFRSSLPDGMYLTQHGEIEGTPTKAGNYYVVVMATPEAGEDYAATAEFELTILAEDAQLYTMEIWEGPKKTEYISGEKLDLTGLRVRIYGPDGYLDSVDGKYLTYTNQPLVTLGEQKISLRYEDAFDVIIVTVKAAPGGNTGDPTEPGTEATTENTGDATEAVTEPGETTDSTKPSKSPAQKGEKDQAENQDNDTDGGDIWFFVAIGLGVLVVGMVVAIVVILKKKKA